MNSTLAADRESVHRCVALAASGATCHTGPPNCAASRSPRLMPLASQVKVREPSAVRRTLHRWLALPSSVDHCTTCCTALPLALSSDFIDAALTML